MPSSAIQRLSIIVPVFNELATLLQTVERIGAASTCGLERQIIVVDDGSTDGTAELLRGGLAGAVEVEACFHPHNRGKGAAIRTGLERATGDIILIQDADLEYDPGDYPRLLQPLLDDKADVVFGSRFLGGEPKRVHLFWHYVGNRLLTTLSNVFTDLNLSDMETGYKAFRADLLHALDLREERFGFEPEVTSKVARRGVRVYEVGISYSGRSYADGKKVSWRDGVRALWCILKYR